MTDTPALYTVYDSGKGSAVIADATAEEAAAALLDAEGYSWAVEQEENGAWALHIWRPAFGRPNATVTAVGLSYEQNAAAATAELLAGLLDGHDPAVPINVISEDSYREMLEGIIADHVTGEPGEADEFARTLRAFRQFIGEEQ